MVLEVTDDTKLPKAQRKQLQIEHASHLSVGGSLVKVAGKICNIRDVAHNVLRGWDDARRAEYLNWAEKVVNECPDTSPDLKRGFAESLASAHQPLDI